MANLQPYISLSVAAAIMCLSGCAAKQVPPSDEPFYTINPSVHGTLCPTPGTPAFAVQAPTSTVIRAVHSRLASSGRYEVMRGEGDWLLVRDTEANLPVSATNPNPARLRCYHVAMLLTFQTAPDGNFTIASFSSLGEITPLEQRFSNDFFNPTNPYVQLIDAARTAIHQSMEELAAAQPVTSR